MLKRVLRHQLLEPELEDLILILDSRFYITKTPARKAKNKDLANISWYETKQLVQSFGSDYFLPTLVQLDKAREHLPEGFRSEDILFAWTDSLLALPDGNGNYSPSLQIPEIERGKVPILIEESKVEKVDGRYLVTEGKVIEVPELPLESGFIQEWDESLGLPTKVGENPNEKFEGLFSIDKRYDFHEGLRALIYGLPPLCELCKGRFVSACLSPSFSHRSLGFYLARVLK